MTSLPTRLTAKQVAEIAARANICSADPAYAADFYNDRRALLSHVDYLSARIASLEKDAAHCRHQYEHLVKIVANIMAVMPPDFVKPDGTVMQFVPPDPLAYLRMLGSAISKAVAETRVSAINDAMDRVKEGG